jgi:farnesyl diphosphate synthase
MFLKSLQHNVSYGKKIRGLCFINAYEALATKSEFEENMEKVNCLAWCIEIFGSYALVYDDIMDGSETRRGRKCWYKVDGVEMSAINDARMLEYGMFLLLKKYFADESYYMKIVELFHEIKLITSIGQLQDLKMSKSCVDTFSVSIYESLVINKTSYYSFFMPVAMAMIMANYKNPKTSNQVKNILFKIGLLFQVQDDIIDCFGDPQDTGKIGTDIQDGKCTWLAVKAMKLANEKQKNIILFNYGCKGENNKIMFG